ncbi:MAG: OmpA family protein [Proteobacteria bacterium]|nr:OmpA family protein [Pseudomonadota bacterium]
MYLSHFGLTEKPFQISSDPKFLWLSEKHKEALAILKYGITDNRGFLLLTGDVGTGKTTLINTLINSIADHTIVAVISDPGLSKLEFYNFLANEFNIHQQFTDKATFLVHFKRFLNDSYENNKKILLVIDEAQRLDHALLEDIRLLSNIEKQQTKLMNIFLIGQNDFNDTLLKLENRAIRQRISLNYHINPLVEHETELYVKHRLMIAGARQPIFDAGAVRTIYYYTKGFPRLINILCDHALLTAYVRERKTIGDDIIKECVDELRITPAKMDYSPTYVSAEIENDTLFENNATPLQKQAETARKTYARNTKVRSSTGLGYLVLTTVIILFAIIGGFYAYSRNNMLSFHEIKTYINNQQFKLTKQTSPLPEEINTDKYDIPVPEMHENNTNESVAHDIAIPIENMDKPENMAAETVEIPDKKIDLAQNRLDEDVNPQGNPEQKEPKSTTAKKEPSYWNTLNPEDQRFYVMVVSGHKIPIQFISNSNDLPKESYKQLSIITEILNNLPESKVTIRGYSDTVGTELYNKKLSEFRANIVKSYIIGNGIDEKRVNASGMGSLNPIASNETSEGRKANRRVEIQIIFERGQKS